MTYLLFFLAYSLLILWFGKHGFEQVQNTRGFFIADSSLGLFAGVCTFVATWFSATSMIALSGSLFVYGFSSITYSVLGWFMGAFLLVYLVRGLRRYNLQTIPEFFRLHYGSRALQALGGIVIIITHILYIVIQIRGFGIVVSEFLQIPYSISLFLVYLFILYTTFGGLYSVARTDMLNICLIFIGIGISVFLVLTQAGGVKEVFARAALIDTRAFPAMDYRNTAGSLLNPLVHGNYPFFLMISAFCGWALGKASNPQYAIRIMAVRDDATARRMVIISIAVLFLLYLGLLVISLGGRVLQPSIPAGTVEDVMPYIIQAVFNSRLSGFMLVGILAAVVSTANSQLLLVASSFSYDIYKNWINPGAAEEKLLALNRATVLLSGTVSLLLSFTPPTGLLLYGSYIWGIIAAAFFVPLYGGFLWRGGNSYGAIASVCGGIGTSLGLYLANRIFFPHQDTLHPAIPGVVAAALLFILASKFTSGRFTASALEVPEAGID